MLEQRIQQHFFDSADLKYASVDILSRPIHDAVNTLLGSITSGGKLLICGQGGAALLAQHAAALFVGPFERERPALAALALGADAGLLGLPGPGWSQLVANQVQALGHPGDVLLALATDGASAAELLPALAAAHDKEMAAVVLTGQDHLPLTQALAETDVCVTIPHTRRARILEAQLMVLHSLCDAVDLQLLGDH